MMLIFSVKSLYAFEAYKWPFLEVPYSQTPSDIFGEYAQAGLEVIAIPHHAIAVRKAVR